jgi:glycosyltransferase involved in cell wall biosynthesis
LVKEADALQEAGHEVRVHCSHYIPWADAGDRELLRTRSWTCTYVGGDFNGRRREGSRAHLLHGLARRLPHAWPLSKTLRRYALCRVLPELAAAASRAPADLYIAHYPGALIAAAEAAHAHRALFAYDAEDFETGSYPLAVGAGPLDRLIESFERQHLPGCSYVTAASLGIAQAYREKFSIPLPTTILNVFPLSERPSQFRPTPPDGPLRLYWFSQTIGTGRGLHDVVYALGQLKHCDIELHLRGRWASGFQAELFALADSLGLPRHRIQAHPPAPPANMVRLAAEYEIGLALELQDTHNHDICVSNKLFTYLLAGNAIVATATAGQQSIMQIVCQAGFSYRPGDAAAFARRLLLWYENRNILEQARRVSWDWGTCRFNWDVEKKTFLQTVEKALRSR